MLMILNDNFYTKNNGENNKVKYKLNNHMTDLILG